MLIRADGQPWIYIDTHACAHSLPHVHISSVVPTDSQSIKSHLQFSNIPGTQVNIFGTPLLPPSPAPQTQPPKKQPREGLVRSSFTTPIIPLLPKPRFSPLLCMESNSQSCPRGHDGVTPYSNTSAVHHSEILKEYATHNTTQLALN